MFNLHIISWQILFVARYDLKTILIRYFFRLHEAEILELTAIFNRTNIPTNSERLQKSQWPKWVHTNTRNWNFVKLKKIIGPIFQECIFSLAVSPAAGLMLSLARTQHSCLSFPATGVPDVQVCTVVSTKLDWFQI